MRYAWRQALTTASLPLHCSISANTKPSPLKSHTGISAPESIPKGTIYSTSNGHKTALGVGTHDSHCHDMQLAYFSILMTHESAHRFPKSWKSCWNRGLRTACIQRQVLEAQPERLSVRVPSSIAHRLCPRKKCSHLAKHSRPPVLGNSEVHRLLYLR